MKDAVRLAGFGMLAVVGAIALQQGAVLIGAGLFGIGAGYVADFVYKRVRDRYR